MTVADRIAVMDKGRIIQVAPPAEIYEQPASCYVAEFIGAVNMFEGVAVASPGVTRIECPSTGVTVEADGDVGAVAGQPTWFAVRPEKVRVTHDAPADTSINAIAGEVWDIGYLGDMSIYHVRLADGRTLRASMANATRVVERPISWDDKVWLSWSRDAGVVLTR